ncbi:hypothetical protein NLG97_g6564 [Lecanicillium saksenae]|uniref:Uncharacterized protein n=1 Tax=Lecanicillium saksenae TaxID=468837 RepID=A0ACC1QRL8_9HYPO|nr:hypothetical protein NLG97_g6564 [Lecanicillium saksenae]
MFPTDVYEYAPLADPSAQIRILKIAFDVKALADHENCGPLTATLKTYNLPKAKLSRTRRLVQFAQLPAFQALSYAWGPPERTRRLFIDNRVLYITENLYLALRDFQRQSVASAYVWADAVCINQADLAERSAQVLLMGEIYHTAFSVQIWIGPSTADGKRCFRFVSALAGYSHDDEVPDESSEERLGKAMAIPAAAVLDVAHKFAKSLFDMVDIVDPKAREDKASITHESDGDRKIISRLSKWRPGEKRLQKVQGESFSEMAALIDLILVRQCSWFERMWVVQELGVSDLADIMYGGSSLPWDSFLQVLFYLHYTCKLRLPSIPMLTGLERIRHGWVDSRRFPLHTLIRSCSYRQASDPRDKIYALYGLMGDQMHDLLRPNYAEPVAEIFANTTQYFILQSKSLDPICNWQTQEGRHLPSWVPDYSLDQTKSGVSFVGEYGKTGLFSSSGFAEQGRYDLVAAAPLGVLPVTVLSLDSVAVLSPRCPENSGFHTAEQIWSKTILGAAHLFQQDIKDLESGVGVVSGAVQKYRTYWELAQPVKSVTPTPELADDWTLASAVARHGELELELDKSNQVDCTVMKMYLYSLCCGIITPSTRISDDDTAVITKLKVPEAPMTSDTDPVWLICEAFENGVKSRVLGVTSKGSICVVPEEAQSGDVVCVMHGCSVPVLLRKTLSASEYLFVGACYMYGFMDGEAIAMQRGGRLVEEKIDIV